MVQLRGPIKRMLDLLSANAKSITVLPIGSLTTHFNLLADFRFCPIMYEGIPFHVRFSYALPIKAIAPIVPMEPINDSIIIKQAQSSSNRSSFLPDLIATTFHASIHRRLVLRDV